jgi:hypothetical protein
MFLAIYPQGEYALEKSISKEDEYPLLISQLHTMSGQSALY